jgi:hypothetical protein
MITTAIKPFVTCQSNTKAMNWHQDKPITALGFTNTHVLTPGIELIDAKNEELHQMLQELREEPYFKLYSVDMLGSCEYMPQQLFECSSETCEIYPVDDDEVIKWQFFFIDGKNILGLEHDTFTHCVIIPGTHGHSISRCR